MRTATRHPHLMITGCANKSAPLIARTGARSVRTMCAAQTATRSGLGEFLPLGGFVGCDDFGLFEDELGGGGFFVWWVSVAEE